jgi:sulfite exporter TauE/SafE
MPHSSWTFVAAVAFGAAGSLHCFVMCGPLACAAQLGRGWQLAALYQLARLGTYALVGAVAGGVGGWVGGHFALPLAQVMPWLLAAVLVLAVVDPGGRGWRRLPPLPGIAQLLQLAARARARLSPPLQALLIGALTPLLPCGLVYAMVGAAGTAGSSLGGATLMAGFALGAVPALVAAQLQGLWLRRLPRGGTLLVQRGLPLIAAALLVYRAVSAARGHSCH